jgi:hypothetical protein
MPENGDVVTWEARRICSGLAQSLIMILLWLELLQLHIQYVTYATYRVSETPGQLLVSGDGVVVLPIYGVSEGRNRYVH